jgi:hypothetical protein
MTNTKEQELVKLEFLMKLNDKIIVQRYFNVREYNHDAKSSYELYEYIKYLKDDMEKELIDRTALYMLENIDDIMANETILNTSMTDGVENFNIFIKHGDNIIMHREFNAKIYPPKVRYTVDLRPKVKEIMKNLVEIFSSKNLTYTYLNYNLAG